MSVIFRHSMGLWKRLWDDKVRFILSILEMWELKLAGVGGHQITSLGHVSQEAVVPEIEPQSFWSQGHCFSWVMLPLLSEYLKLSPPPHSAPHSPVYALLSTLPRPTSPCLPKVFFVLNLRRWRTMFSWASSSDHTRQPYLSPHPIMRFCFSWVYLGQKRTR